MSSKATEIAKNLPTLEHPDGSPIRALVVDDEEMLKELVSMGLKMIGWEVQSAGDGPTALAIARDWRPDVLVLDIMMPGFDGLELLDRIRKFYPEVPCLFLTAKDSVDNRIEGLAAGADDYVTKPFSNRELQARVKALLRRSEILSVDNQEVEAKLQSIQIGDLEILPDAYVAKKYGEELELTHREFELLYHLATHIGQVITREHLLETVWGYDYFGDVRTVDVTIRRLREKIEDTPSRPDYILTRRGVGYYMRNND